MFVYCLVLMKFSHWLAILVGSGTGLAIGLCTEYFTSSRPVYRIIEASNSGPATNLITGLSVGFLSCCAPVALIAIAIASTTWIGGPEDGVYCIALAAVAMLSTVGISMSVEAYAPIVDNARGICQMSGCEQDSRSVIFGLSGMGTASAVIGKGFAAGSAALTTLALLAAYAQAVLASTPPIEFSILNPTLLIGLFIGSMIPCVVAALTMTSVGYAASQMVAEIRRQFHEIPGLLQGRAGVKPDIASCTEISATAALKEMVLPGLLAILAPLLMGFVFGPVALGGMLLGALITGFIMALFMSTSGSAWDSAKNYMELGLIESSPPGSAAHKAALVGDAVGDPFKDTAGPALNILIKLMSIVALLIAPLIA